MKAYLTIEDDAEMIVCKSQLLINIADTLGIPFTVCKPAKVDASDVKGIPKIRNHRWKVNVGFETCITSPKMPDEEAIKRALKTQIIYNAETDEALEEFIEEMDWDDPTRE